MLGQAVSAVSTSVGAAVSTSVGAAVATSVGAAIATSVGTAVGDKVCKYGKKLLNKMSKVDNDLENNHEMLMVQAKKLSDRKDDILAECQLKTKYVTQECEDWISSVMKSEEKVRELETRYNNGKSKKRKFQLLYWSSESSESCESLAELSKRMAEMKEKLCNLEWKGNSEIGIKVEKLPERVIIMHGPKTEDELFFHSIVEEILGHLRGKDVKRLGIWGIAGIGKTTIMQILNNNENIIEIFDIVISVTVSKDWSTENLQRTIANRLKLNMEGMTDHNEIAQIICRELKSKKCLLLLDEVGEALVLPLIGMLYDSEKDSKVVLATRIRDVCCDMETDEEINVQRLSKTDAWKMFKVKVGRNVNLPGIEPIAKLVANECAGWPLLIDKVARIFRKKDNIDLWNDGLNRLRWPNNKILGIEELIEFVKFCYENLEDEVTKKCFLYCARYAEDDDIFIDDLLERWTAEVFIHDANELRDARGKGLSILAELIDVSLLEKSEMMNHVRMNKVQRNMALEISSQRCD